MNSTLNFGIMPLIVVCIPVRSLLLGRQTSNCSNCSTNWNNFTLILKKNTSSTSQDYTKSSISVLSLFFLLLMAIT